MENGDFSEFMNTDDSNFDSDENNEIKTNKLKDLFLSFDKKILIILGIIFVIIIIVIFVAIKSSSVKVNEDYSLDIDLPDVVYMNETIDVSGEIVGKDTEKSDNALTEFVFTDSDIIDSTESEFIGDTIDTTFVPIKAGSSKVFIKSFIPDNKKDDGILVAEVSKDIIVCPSFNSNLLKSNTISVLNGGTKALNIDFGEKACRDNIGYESSNSDVMMVTGDGIIIGVNKGSAKLKITKDNKEIVADVMVK